MSSEESLVGAVAAVISKFAQGPTSTKHPGKQPNGSDTIAITLPCPDSVAKTLLERELSLLATRIRTLETCAHATAPKSIVETPSHDVKTKSVRTNGDTLIDAATATRESSRRQSQDKQPVEPLSNSSPAEGLSPGYFSGQKQLTEDQAHAIHKHVERQAQQINSQREIIDRITMQLAEQREKTDAACLSLTEHGDSVGVLNRELKKSKQANMAFSKALREIGNIISAVATGDFSKKVLIHAVELDPEITNFKKTINQMVDQLQDFASQVSHLAKEVGTEGRLGGQARLRGVQGIWAELAGNVNSMADNLTNQVREIALVTTAVAHGDLSRKIERPAKGEILELQQTINIMVDQLRTFATEVTKVARDVGTEGVLGGQAQIEGVQGMWNDLTVNVNAMANNLTTQVRDIAKVTTAVAKGDLTQKVSATCKGEILDLKTTINAMVDQLQQFAHEVTNLAQEVGTEGRLGGQATVHGVEGTWRDLTQNVNVMAMKLTTQVREIAEVTTAVARGDLSKKVTADVKGEVLSLKNTINNMVDQLGIFAFEVSKVAREVGTEGTLGGQAKVENVEGKWKDLTDNVNTMAQNLTGQVRSISDITQAIARGDLSRKIHVHAQGEILLLKTTINGMVSRLDNWSLALKDVARDVGVDGKMGGQAPIDGLEGRWKEITLDVNTMAQNLTSQVRAFADITNAANSGDFTQEITIAASGEMDELKRKINKMVSGLRESIEKNAKAREVAELANSTKSQFLANMSHEIRTPMNGIIGMTQLTLDSELTTYQRDMLNTVHQLANSLLTIIDDILDISKIEANRMEVDMQPFSIRVTTYNALKSLVVKANDRGLTLAYEVESNTFDYVRGDSLRLRQIIMNLVGNAVKFTEAGEVKVSILEASQKGCKDNEYMVKFAVSDTGIGIQRESLGIIFDSFKQADNSTTRQFGGTGLGLSISKRLVNLHGGEMWVKSEYGKGSTFYFTIKFQKGVAELETIQAQLKPYQNHSILLIDQGHITDIESICNIMREVHLSPIVTRKKPGDKLEVPNTDKRIYDCVVVDNNECARQLRKVDQFKYVPIVMLAPVVSVGFKSALEDGISSYMTTPCLPIDIANALIPALEGRATPQKSDHTSSFNILLAEDNPINQKLAIQILEKYDHKVSVANNGLEAVEAIKKRDFDVVLMDVQMPVMGGFEATKTIREWEREHKIERTPILALTAHAMLGDREKCLQAEMDDYLSKPLKRNELIQCIIKYATMSGAMLDSRSKARRFIVPDESSSALPTSLQSTDQSPPKRPKGPDRGHTDVPGGAASPRIVVEERLNPFERTFMRSHSS